MPMPASARLEGSGTAGPRSAVNEELPSCTEIDPAVMNLALVCTVSTAVCCPGATSKAAPPGKWKFTVLPLPERGTGFRSDEHSSLGGEHVGDRRAHARGEHDGVSTRCCGHHADQSERDEEKSFHWSKDS